SCRAALAADPPTVVASLGELFRSLAAYAALGDGPAAALPLLHHWGWHVAAMTLAHKTKSTTAALRERYGRELALRDGERRLLARWPAVASAAALGPPPPEPLGGGKDAAELLERLLRRARRRWRSAAERAAAERRGGSPPALSPPS